MANDTKVIKVKDAQPMGEYNQTLVDKKKKEVDFLLKDISHGNVIQWKDGTRETVTTRELNKLKRIHTWMTDF